MSSYFPYVNEDPPYYQPHHDPTIRYNYDEPTKIEDWANQKSHRGLFRGERDKNIDATVGDKDPVDYLGHINPKKNEDRFDTSVENHLGDCYPISLLSVMDISPPMLRGLPPANYNHRETFTRGLSHHSQSKQHEIFRHILKRKNLDSTLDVADDRVNKKNLRTGEKYTLNRSYLSSRALSKRLQKLPRDEIANIGVLGYPENEKKPHGHAILARNGLIFDPNKNDHPNGIEMEEYFKTHGPFPVNSYRINSKFTLNPGQKIKDRSVTVKGYGLAKKKIKGRWVMN